MGVGFGQVQYSIEERQFLQNELEQKLDQDMISKRDGPSGAKVHYIETWKAIAQTNRLFGFNGWSSKIMEINLDFIDQVNGRFTAGVSAIVRITLKDGSFREDIGYGISENQKQKGKALEQGKKKAVSDALKRALKAFGHALGLSVYDKDHLKEVEKSSRLKSLKSGAASAGGAMTLAEKAKNPHFNQPPGSPPKNSFVTTTTVPSMGTATHLFPSSSSSSSASGSPAHGNNGGTPPSNFSKLTRSVQAPARNEQEMQNSVPPHQQQPSGGNNNNSSPGQPVRPFQSVSKPGGLNQQQQQGPQQHNSSMSTPPAAQQQPVQSRSFVPQQPQTAMNGMPPQQQQQQQQVKSFVPVAPISGQQQQQSNGAGAGAAMNSGGVSFPPRTNFAQTSGPVNHQQQQQGTKRPLAQIPPTSGNGSANGFVNKRPKFD